MKRIKVLFLIHDLSVGGAEKVLVNLVNNMDKNRFDITVMSLFGGGVNEQYLNKDIKYIKVFKKLFKGNSIIMKLFKPKTLHSWLIKDKYDIEISYLEGPCSRIISGCQNEETKLVAWIHTEHHTKEVASASFRNYEESKKCYERFNKIICVSNYVKEDFASIYPSLKDIDVKYNTIETNRIIKEKDEKIEIDFNKKEFKLCGIGKIAKNKGFDRLARIHCRLRKQGYPIHTYILGVGDQKNIIEEYLRKNNELDSFTFLGYQTNPYKYVSKCDLFACSSLSEGFSTAASESLIVGTPVITTLVSGMKEMLGENNEHGIIVEQSEDSLYEGIKRLIDDKHLLEHYKNQAKIRGLMFSTENTVKAVEDMLMNIYEE